MSKNIYNLVIIILCVHLFQCNGDSLRIFQGRDAHPGEFSYVVALAMKVGEDTQLESYDSFCTGSIVTPVWTLTAGHCIEGTSDLPENSNLVIVYTISSENHNLKWGASKIIRTILHPGQNIIGQEQKVYNDIGLLKTNKVSVPALGKLSPVDYHAMYGHKVSIAGFGLMNSEKGIDYVLALNKSLQVNEVMVMKCPNLAPSFYRPSICLTWECNKPATLCSGDSGGPVIHPTGIIAVNTAGSNIECNTVTGIFQSGIVTPISPFLDWIARNIRDK